MKKKIIYLFLISIPLSLITVELIIRLIFYITNKEIRIFRPTFYYSNSNSDYLADSRRFRSHAFMPYAAKPNDSRTIYIYRNEIGKILSYKYTNNSLGFRTPERSLKKPLKTKRVIVLGGSTAWEGPTNDSTWPALLEKKLNSFYQDKNIKIEVINLALDGASSAMSLTILNQIGVEYQPDLVISYDGINDVDYANWRDVAPDYSNYLKPFDENIKPIQAILPKWTFNSYIISILSKGIEQHFSIVPNDLQNQIKRDPPLRFTDKTVFSGLDLFLRNLKLMRGVCVEYNCKFVASIPHWAIEPDSFGHYFDNNTKVFLAGQKINYLDLQNIFPHDDYSIHSDYVHWTDKGLDMMAEEWLKKITQENLLSY